MVRCSEGAEESSSRTLARDLPESALEEEEEAAAVGGEGGCGERGARPGEQCKDGFSEQPVGDSRGARSFNIDEWAVLGHPRRHAIGWVRGAGVLSLARFRTMGK